MLAASLSEKKNQLSRTKGTITSTQQNLNRLAQRYQNTEHELKKIAASIDKASKEVEQAEKRLQVRQEVLQKRADYIYRHGRVNIIEVVFGSTDFRDFATRVDFMNRITQADARLMRDIVGQKNQVVAKRTQLLAKKGEKRKLAQRLKKERDSMESKLSGQQRDFNSLKSEIAQLEAKIRRESRLRESILREYRQSRSKAQLAKLRKQLKGLEDRRGFRSSRSSGTRGARILFPIPGPHAFSNTWGASRSGGRRHKGTDIFAPYGAPVVATVSGRVKRSSGGNGGLMVWLRGSDGNTYFYAHLSRFGKSGSVKAGDVIGYNGSSGNARGGSPHVHFEFHPGGGGAVNPYPLLRASD